MCMLDCLLVSAIMFFYTYKAKNMNGRHNIFTSTQLALSTICLSLYQSCANMQKRLNRSTCRLWGRLVWIREPKIQAIYRASDPPTGNRNFMGFARTTV